MSMTERIREKLSGAFKPSELTIEDESARHAGHAGARPGGGTHFRVRIVSPAFAGMSRIDRQRAIYAALGDEMKTQIHALSLAALTPGEAQR